MMNKTETTVVLDGGAVEYSLEEAALDIDQLIESLEEAKEQGATHVVMSSGNYRGAQWARLGTTWEWAGDL